MARTPAQALAWAAARRGSRLYNGICLKLVREAYGVAARFPSAIAAWNGASKRHGNLATAPDGAPVYLSHPKSRYGHVALLRRVNGEAFIETTNSAVGRTVLQPLSLWTGSYGYRLLGWTEDINGVDVCDPIPVAAPKPAPAAGGGAVLRKGSRGASVSTLQNGLRTKFPGYRDDVSVKRGQLISVDGSYGAQTEAWVKEFQERTGLKPDGIVGPKTRAKLAQYGIRI